MAKMIEGFTDRGESHAALEAARAGKYPMAECREDPNSDTPYQVWDGPEEWVMPAPAEPPDPALVLAQENAVLDRLAERVVAMLAERGV